MNARPTTSWPSCAWLRAWPGYQLECRFTLVPPVSKRVNREPALHEIAMLLGPYIIERHRQGSAMPEAVHQCRNRLTWADGLNAASPICKNSRRLVVNKFLPNDGNDILLVPVVVFEHQQPTTRSQSQRSMFEVPASTFWAPRSAPCTRSHGVSAQGAACSASLCKNDIPDALHWQGRDLPAPEFGAVMTLRSTASPRGAGEANRPDRRHTPVPLQRASTKGMGLNAPVQDLLNATDRHPLALRPTAQGRISSTF